MASFKNTINFRTRERPVNLWRSNTFSGFSELRRNDSTILKTPKDKLKKINQSWSTVVTVVLVEAKCLPPVSDDGVSHSVYCKLKLGSENLRSKSIARSQRPEWRERFQFHLFEDHNLRILLYDNGRMKNAMGSCNLDLSLYEKERTHEIWQELTDGYGVIHVTVTMCDIRNIETPSKPLQENDCNEKHSIQKLPNDWDVVGLLHVKLICAKGFISTTNAYCTLEIDNESVETHRAGSSTDPRWNKCYIFKVYDVSSTLDLKVYDSSLTNAILHDSIGKVSIPLLRISNGLTRWYALKDRSKRNNARGNCPRILLQMSLVFNPVKATMKLFKSKEVKYIKKPAKFDIPLIYKNIKYVSDLLNFLEEINQYYKIFFEWDDREYSFVVLLCWLIVCLYLSPWVVPLILLLPFVFNGIFNRQNDNTYILQERAHEINKKEEISLTGKIQEIHKMAFTIIDGIEFIVSYIERLQSLVTFKVPFLSYVTMLCLIAASSILYLVPFNYLLMSLGLYKFIRKYLNPNRISNNDIIDFLSRVPDKKILKDWKELGVPEPTQEYTEHTSKITRSISELH